MLVEQTLIEAKEISLWSQCLEALRTKISESALNTWFSALEIVETSPSEVVIGVPNGFVLEYVSHHYRQVLERTMTGIMGENVSVSFTVVSGAPMLELLQTDSRNPENRMEAGGFPVQEALWVKSRGPVRVEVTVPLNVNYTFENFVIGDCNQLAHAACMAVAEAPSHNNFNPLILYGGTGMGKTHLVQAIAHFCI